jgi:uncharacterized circularly permuted ATP-grasp superfamily protein/uncharacterized alpha-E superfamily protein
MLGSSPAPMLRGGDVTALYAAGVESFDELMTAAGAIKPHWQPFLGAIGALDPVTRSLRMEQLNTRVRETGIAYDLFSDPASTAQPWRVDLVPLIIAPEEWRQLERALLQRARLFEAMLTDLYGPQRLLASGAIPHQLVFSDPSYLRPCRNLRTGGGYIQFFATDVARGLDGRWRVIDTHTETPAGIGYALANRMVHTNVAGEVFAACDALRLAPFFQQMQGALERRANRVDPSIALLTPGPRHNDFFSHAYLARYLGQILVEGGDLRVVDGRVSLKTLDGLLPIDLIVRCVAGAVADPLELDSAGFAGPVGLLQAVRREPDLIVNALGTALAENRGLSSYLPRLAKELLGEELAIPDGPRLWLGDRGARQHVLANLDRMVIRPAHEGTARPGRAVPGRDPATLGAAERAALLTDIELRGPMLVAEEKIGFGTTPSLTPTGLVPKPYALRLFVSATAGGFMALPGGLAMTVDPGSTVALSAPDGEARDVWIVSDASMPPFVSLWRPAIEAAQIQRTPHDLPSRAADNLYWLGRYTERADWTMRVLRICLSRLQEDSGPRQELRASRIALEILLSKDDGDIPSAQEATDAALIEKLARNLLTSTDWYYGLPRTLDNIHRVASLTRDRLSLEAWRTLNDFYAKRRWTPDASPKTIGGSLDLLDDGLRVLAAFHGLTHENMTRNYGWSFLDMGRRLSRALNLSEALLGIFGKPQSGEDETGSLLFVLELADSFITYRSRYRMAPVLPLVLDLLLIDESNPRSVAFQLAALERHIDQLPQSNQGGNRIEEQRSALTVLTQVRVAQAMALAEIGPEGSRLALQGLLSQQAAALPQLSEAIGRRYFNLVEKGVRWVRARSRADQ